MVSPCENCPPCLCYLIITNRSDGDAWISCIRTAEWNECRLSSQLRYLTILKQQRERSENFRSEQGFEPWPVRCWCSAPLVEPTGKFGTGVLPSCISISVIYGLIVDPHSDQFQLVSILRSRLRDVTQRSRERKATLLLSGERCVTSWKIDC